MSNQLMRSGKNGPLWKQKGQAERLRNKALLAGAGTLVVTGLISMASFPLGVIVGLAGLGLTASQAWKWIQYRGKWGLKF